VSVGALVAVGLAVGAAVGLAVGGGPDTVVGAEVGLVVGAKVELVLGVVGAVVGVVIAGFKIFRICCSNSCICSQCEHIVSDLLKRFHLPTSQPVWFVKPDKDKGHPAGSS